MISHSIIHSVPNKLECYAISLFRISRNAALSLCLFSSCKNDLEEVNSVTTNRNRPAEVSTGIEFMYLDSGFMRIKLSAPEMRHFIGEDPYNELTKGILLTFFDTDMEIDSRLTADYGINYEKKGMFEAKGNVVVVNSKGETLNTEHLIWDVGQEIIYTNAYVKITTADEIIMGEGMEANQDFSKYKIKKIKGTIRIKEDENGNRIEEK